MQHALALASRQLGQVWPNPAVGCIIEKDGNILSAGVTQKNGRPHAEKNALDALTQSAKGATAYVTLEPCAHEGATPSCATLLAESGVSRVVVACRDPDPRTNGQGIALLLNAGIEVIEDICHDEAWKLNEGFFRRTLEQRPLITLKLATSLDGKIATASGHSQWITGKPARNYGHLLRSQHDAILTGIGTVLADNPQLNCRLNGLEDRSPVRIIMDTHLRIPLESHLVQSAQQHPVWVITSPESCALPKAQELQDKNLILIPCPVAHKMLDINAAMELLAQRGITRVLAESGSTLATALWNAQLIDELYWFRAPMVLGDSGLSAISTLPDNSLQNIARPTLKSRFSLGVDAVEVYRVSPCLPALSHI